jgi:molybdate transport system ATP-binding protein
MGSTLCVDVALLPSRERPLAVEMAFRVPPGITVLLGPSGAGKSTVLAMVAGLLRPDRGRVELERAEPSTSAPPGFQEVWFDSTRRLHRPPHKRGVAFVFQSLALFPHLTALANVEYGIDRSVPSRQRRERAQALLARMHVGHLATRRPETFSGGEAQRVALARAAGRRPTVMLLDEPFSALDRELRVALGQDLKTMVAELGIPALLVTHHRNEARAVGDRMVTVAEGRVQAVGGVDELLPEPMSPAR